ncbi:MAG: hypothetical protein M3066_10515 [Actinomycetota bacterium]|nr:hypothetical protein [Actinomycetota bacterium]
MPWCEDCNRHLDADELGEGDTCPTCGKVLDTKPSKAPWHFKLLVGSLSIYLSWRAVQGIEWVVHHF